MSCYEACAILTVAKCAVESRQYPPLGEELFVSGQTGEAMTGRWEGTEEDKGAEEKSDE